MAWPAAGTPVKCPQTKTKIISGQGKKWVHFLVSEGTEVNILFKNHLAFRETRDPNLVCGDNRVVEDEEDVDEILSVHYYLLKVKGLQGALEGKAIDA